MTASPLAQAVRRARRRLFLAALATRLPVAVGVALALSAVWVAAGPFLVEAVPLTTRWPGVALLVVLGTVTGIVLARRATPVLSRTALEVDRRFQLGERIATALGLTDRDRETPAGKALLADAVAQVAPVKISERFPVALRWQMLLVPAGLGLVVLATLVPVDRMIAELTGRPVAGEATMSEEKPADPAKPKVTAAVPPPALKPRLEKSKQLQELEDAKAKLDQKYDTDPNRETAEKLKERAAELTSLEQKVKQFEQAKAEKMQKLDAQLQQLERLKDDKDFEDGPAKKLKDSLAKGDLQKAKDDVDELKKKVQDKSLTKEEAQKLAKQIDKIKEQMAELNRAKEREKKLEQAAEKARAEGRNQDAESLERELAEVQKDRAEAEEATSELRESFQKAKDALERGDMEEAAEQLTEAGKQLGETGEELEDLADAEEFLQRLKKEREEACKKCNGNCKGDKFEPNDDAEWTPEGKIGAGRRKEDRTAQTAEGEGERIRGIFDPKGRKSYGGATRGNAFKTGSVGELGPAIQSAAQEAPAAADSQRLPRDARESVKDYFEALGGHK